MVEPPHTSGDLRNRATLIGRLHPGRHANTMRRLAAAGAFGLVLTTSGWDQTRVRSNQQQEPAIAPTLSAGISGTPGPKNQLDGSYVIGNSDQLEINVWNEAGLTVTVPVRSDGMISMPLIGEILASGKTPGQLTESITLKLRSYLAAPNVTVIVMQMNSQRFNILGRVLKPGSYPLFASTTVLDAIAEAGGFQDFAKQKQIYVLRQAANGNEARFSFNYKEVIRGSHIGQNIQLKPNDTIIVP